MALAASGRYTEAVPVFAEARRFGHEHGIGTLMARAIAISAGYHLDVFDFAVNEELAQEARELARSVEFPPPTSRGRPRRAADRRGGRRRCQSNRLARLAVADPPWPSSGRDCACAP